MDPHPHPSETVLGKRVVSEAGGGGVVYGHPWGECIRLPISGAGGADREISRGPGCSEGVSGRWDVCA